MANTNAPFGLRWLGLNNSPATPSAPIKNAKFAEADTQKAYRGDLLYRLTTGYVRAVVAAGATSVASLAAGVFLGCSYLSTSQGKRIFSPYWPGGDATGDIDVQMIPLVGSTPQLFVAQATSTAFAFANIGENVDIGYQAGVAYSGWSKSGLTIAQSTLGTGQTLPFVVEGLWSQYERAGQPGTDDASSYNWVIVSYNALDHLGNA